MIQKQFKNHQEKNQNLYSEECTERRYYENEMLQALSN